MSSCTAVRSTPAARHNPALRRLSLALSTAMNGPESSELTFDQALLDRLDAICQSIQTAPDQALPSAMHGTESSESAFDQALLDRLDAIFRSIQPAPKLDQAIRLPSVLSLVGVSKSTWYALLNPRSRTFDPRAPQPFKLGPSANSPSVWWRSAVMAYLNACASSQVRG